MNKNNSGICSSHCRGGAEKVDLPLTYPNLIYLVLGIDSISDRVVENIEVVEGVNYQQLVREVNGSSAQKYNNNNVLNDIITTLKAVPIVPITR
jgi:hypothetical protein